MPGPASRALPPDVRMMDRIASSYVTQNKRVSSLNVAQDSTWDACICWVCIVPGAVAFVFASSARRLNLQCKRMFVELGWASMAG
jgi:hypothetical protein